MKLAGKVAIISGAASGMGAATARMFAREGAKAEFGRETELSAGGNRIRTIGPAVCERSLGCCRREMPDR